ncbi:hypothetical protein A2662_03305 [Candidatus Giovannonibacteria bacterium RIFCSPHIGHO2_01_FULL_45_33]|uniref:Peptidase A2 domain-containing protein n=1 Tax=Candidatus Giovannonibacteria bacterium RIFCSPLOWO2_01_FULL_45_34 TaxID=1798351 RepID=A0A1F5WZN6_9BACT|nr:MAG: hypothetical protein A2662_03305 [Candidatus Giovannonibacteria bacterium RIFCSPHIGHO2_01_FULL_45_33]OGF70259.1 MAG: hypothetical protein A3C73_01190 [Candidatus Giovannonibacteria bacterium RIFCSPHIGHO2_02_FULL_44_11]OGF81100.1 MAG: hypothetical protein A2930_00830 [Candidatus Giovannonibacteria bacterium RIFCSPLOWO2_01_FULL_45_34]
MKYDYTRESPLSYTSKITRKPRIEVEFFGKEKSVKVFSIVDSGADITLINEEIAQFLDIDLKGLPLFKTLGITGNSSDVRIGKIKIKLPGYSKVSEIKAQFLIGKGNFDVLLGQDDFFDKHRIKFERDHFVFEITPVK